MLKHVETLNFDFKIYLLKLQYLEKRKSHFTIPLILLKMSYTELYKQQFKIKML